MTPQPSRRALLQAPLAAAALSATAPVASSAAALEQENPEKENPAKENPSKTPSKGRIRQAGVLWCYGGPLADLAKVCQTLGLHGVDVVHPRDFPILKEHGLVCTMTPCMEKGIGLRKGLNKKEHHETHFEVIKERIDRNVEFGFKNVLVFSGDREEGLSDAEGLENCAAALRELAPYAEKHGQVLQMEILNSKRDHKGYMFDSTPWGVELVQKVGSPAFKILYDIYHAQIMEGDVIQTIRDHHEHIGHYHTAGVPGRSNIDETQELYYPAIMGAIAETGYEGYVSHEFRPRGDKVKALTNAVEICDV